MSNNSWTVAVEAMPVNVAAVAFTAHHEQYSMNPNLEDSCYVAAADAAAVGTATPAAFE